ncbi:Hypothetical predicted protein [Pelobates cultripes]|uniref:Uncharacterized protein n=1 Tax=Pelobates cultripes TaxID=61616 RepID=A0AAD1VJW8_PELCU|nr:Hypothetical predicted protein [Pelobates cultripes]
MHTLSLGLTNAHAANHTAQSKHMSLDGLTNQESIQLHNIMYRESVQHPTTQYNVPGIRTASNYTIKCTGNQYSIQLHNIMYRESVQHPTTQYNVPGISTASNYTV